MEDIFGWLTGAQWLAFLRIAVGLWWLKSAQHKPLPGFVEGGMVKWTLSLADNHPIPAIGSIFRRLIEPNASWFPYFQLFGEAAVGLGLTLGFLTPVAALVAIFMNINFYALAGVRPKDKSVNPGYQCEQGQNLMMIAAEIVIFFMGAGAVWSLDSLLGLF